LIRESMDVQFSYLFERGNNNGDLYFIRNIGGYSRKK
jgi:hypothetical protein